MKKIILAAALFIGVFAQAQIVVTDGDVQLENDATYTYATLGEQAKMHITVTNGTLNPIYVKLKMEEITNNNAGSGVQFCYGQLCYYDIQEGITAPTGGHTQATTIAPGANNGTDGYFFNNFAGDTAGQPVVYKMSIINIDTAGVQVGEPIITFTYVYSTTAATADFTLAKMGIAVNNTIVTNTLDLTASQNAKLELININGQSVKKAAITNGTQSVDLSGIASGVYFAKFTNEENKTAQIKIVKN